MTFDEIVKEVERKTKAGELTDLERQVFLALLRAGSTS